jgi:hypothetical protein
MVKVNYETDEERVNFIEQYTSRGMILKEDAILIDEKYLVFDDASLPDAVLEPIDEEKAAMAEAIIDMTAEIELLKSRLEALEGGI